MGSIIRHTSRGQLVPLYFGQDAVAASQSGVALPTVAPEEGSATTTYTMPFAGSIVAVTAELTAAATAGTLTLEGTIGGAEVEATALAITTATAASQVVTRDTATFVAGASIGAELTTDGSWDATTADLNVIVWVLLQLEGI